MFFDLLARRIKNNLILNTYMIKKNLLYAILSL
jgi:hypothetical protein